MPRCLQEHARYACRGEEQTIERTEVGREVEHLKEELGGELLESREVVGVWSLYGDTILVAIRMPIAARSLVGKEVK